VRLLSGDPHPLRYVTWKGELRHGAKLRRQKTGGGGRGGVPAVRTTPPCDPLKGLVCSFFFFSAVPDLAGIAGRDGQFSRCWEFLVKKK